MKPYLQKTLAVSVISFMELLSFPGITGDEEKMIRQFLNMRKIIQIDKDVMEKTISDEAIEKLRDECKERRVYFDARTKIHLKEYLDSRDDMNPALFVTLDAPHDRLKISGVEIRLRNLVKKSV